MPPKKKKEQPYWIFNRYRLEWICKHGVGHYDPRFVSYTVHGCDGCCSREDFPGKQPLKKKEDE